MFAANEAAAEQGDSTKLYRNNGRTGNHFVAFVKGKDEQLWELEGSRKGPLDRGGLSQGEDVFSQNALELGIKRVMEMQEADGGTIRFSCIALAPSLS